MPLNGIIQHLMRRPPPMSASLIGHLGSSAFRLSTTIAVSMSLTGSCFSSESAPGPLYGVFFVEEFAMAAKLSFVGFLVRSQSLFLRPDLRIADVDASFYIPQD